MHETSIDQYRNLKKTESRALLETKLLISVIHEIYGYDFKHYHLSTIRNRFENHRDSLGLTHISEMIPKVLYDKIFFRDLFLEMSVTVTEMFRAPSMFKSLKNNVLPHLKTYPYFNIWHAGCATGEEAYSMAIFLKEETVLNRAQLYATDINDRSLGIAKKGIYPIGEMKKNTNNYNLSGGKGTLSDHYHTFYRAAKMNSELKDNLTFANHNLVTDGTFAEMQLIVCRNVLIYFDNSLKNRVLKLFSDSLCNHGFLCLGENESLEFSLVASDFELIDEKSKIYRKK